MMIDGPIWELASQLYALEIIVARLYSSLAHESDNPEELLERAMKLCLLDAKGFASDQYPNEEAVNAMRDAIERMVKRFFSGFITEASS